MWRCRYFMDAARPSLLLVVAVGLVAVAVGSMHSSRVASEAQSAADHSLMEARIALKRSEVEAMQAHIWLLEQQIHPPFDFESIDPATLEEFQKQLDVGVGPSCRGLACYD